MKKFILLAVIAVLFAYCDKKAQVINQEELSLKKATTCITLQSGTILYAEKHYLKGQPIPLGYDAYGYNYQAHMFSGSYANIYLGGDGFPPYDGNDVSYLDVNPTAAAHWT